MKTEDNNKEQFGQFVKRMREKNNLTIGQVSRYSGLNSGYISQVENGRRAVPKPKTIDKLAKGIRINRLSLYEVAGIIPEGLLEEAGLKEIKHLPVTYDIPVYGQIVAGYPNGFDDDRMGTLPVPEKYIKEYGKDNLLALKVVGDSMNKKITNGSIALIHKTTEFENGNIMAVIIDGDTATLKHLYKYPDFLRFVPDSYDKSLKPFEYTNKQIKNSDPTVLVIGKYLYSSSPELVE